MLEKFKAVNNPLTVIALFAGLAEVAGTVALATVEKELQQTFVWFVMAFPTLIVTAFFITLNFNPRVLYAPSDFKNEEHFLSLVAGARALSVNLDELSAQLEQAKKEIVTQSLDAVRLAGEAERNKLAEIVARSLKTVQSKVEVTRQNAENVAAEVVNTDVAQSELQSRILAVLGESDGFRSLLSLTRAVGIGGEALRRALRRLEDRGAIIIDEDCSGDDVVVLPQKKSEDVRS